MAKSEAMPCGGGQYPNLNSGSMIGEAADVLAVLADVDADFPQGLEAANMNDQAAMQYAYLDAERTSEAWSDFADGRPSRN